MNSLRAGLVQRPTSRRLLPLCLSVLVLSVALHSSNAAPRHAKVAAQGIAGIESIALFPSANDAGPAGSFAAAQLDTAIRLRLQSSGVYQVTTFSTRLPSIQRAVNVDNTLTDSDVQSPVTDSGSAMRIANVMSTDGYILEEVDSYSTDPKTNAVSVTISGNLYFTSNGSAARTFAVTGSATPLSDDDTAQSLSQRAVNSAAAQILTSLSVSPAAEKPASTLPPSNARAGRTFATDLLVALGAVFVAVILHNAGTHHSSSTNNGSSSSTSTTGGTGGGATTGSSTTGGPPPAPF